MTDLNPKAQDAAQKTLQEIADRMLPEYAGADVERTRQALVEAIAAAGLPEQPPEWVTDTRAESSARRAGPAAEGGARPRGGDQRGPARDHRPDDPGRGGPAPGGLTAGSRCFR